MADDRSAVNRLLGALISPAVDAVDPDAVIDRVDIEHLVARIDLDAVVARIDLDAVLDRIDWNALLAEIDLDAVLQRVDVNALLATADVDALVRRIDLNALLADVDINALIDRLDLDAVLAKADVDALVSRIDINAVAGRIDLDALLTGVDINAVVGRVDINALASQLDLNTLLAQLDVDTLVGRVDINAVVARVEIDDVLETVDVKALVKRAEIEDMIASATTGVAAKTLDLARRQLVGADLILTSTIDRLLRRPREAVAAGEVSASGWPAGPISRLLAFLADSAVVSALFSGVVFLGVSGINLFFGDTISTGNGTGPLWLGGYLLWWLIYLWGSVAIARRTAGKALVGLRVEATDGSRLSARRALVRALVLPLSFVAGIGFLLGVVRRDRRCLHDLIAGSQEVIDWGDRSASLPSAIEGWFTQHRDDAAEDAEPPPGVTHIRRAG